MTGLETRGRHVGPTRTPFEVYLDSRFEASLRKASDRLLHAKLYGQQHAPACLVLLPGEGPKGIIPRRTTT